MTAAALDPGLWIPAGDPHPRARRWITPRLSRLAALGVRAVAEYRKLYSDGEPAQEFRANTWLREIYTEVQPFFAGTLSADSIEDIAGNLADRFAGAVKCVQMGAADVDEVETGARAFLAHLNLAFPAGQTRQSKLLRLGDVKWWRRRLNRAVSRIVDQTGRSLGMVHKDGEIYISDAALEMYRSRQRAGAELLAEMIATNDAGQQFTVADLAARSVSNPAARRTEMLVRIRGTEELADELGHGALFVTLTAPSKYHAVSKGRPNPKYQGATPADTNEYFNGVWSRVRAELHRRQISVYGMWVSEPHHDGTPHKHFLLFGSEANLYTVRGIFRHYAHAEDGTEPGAFRRRVVFERINRARGSAVGYIAKYVSKSVDGAHVDADRYNVAGDVAAERIVAWSRTWGIRQFQFFGCAPIGPWRELRRVRRAAPFPYTAAAQAADTANFAEYSREHDAEAFTVYRQSFVDEITGETDAPFNDYGEIVPPPVRGICAHNAQPLITRLFDWVITRRRPQGAGAWTCVNNCTPEPENTFQPGEFEHDESRPPPNWHV